MIIGRNFWRHFSSPRWKDFEFLLNFFQVYEAYKMARPSRKACKVKSRAKTVFVPLHFSIYCIHLPLS